MVFFVNVWPSLCEGLLQNPDKLAVLIVKAASAELKRLDAAQPSKTGWKVTGTRHARPCNQDGDDRDFTLQASFDLKAHEVIRIIDAAPANSVCDREPPIADHRQQGMARLDGLGDLLNEVVARSDRFNVLEDLAVGEMASQSVT